jgi:hypothetical protein
MDLLLRPTVLTGEKLKDDYCVFHEGRIVGRIIFASDRSWRGVLQLVHQPPCPDPALVQGTDSLEAAKIKFRAAWERFYASLTPELIAHWHRNEARLQSH